MGFAGATKKDEPDGVREADNWHKSSKYQGESLTLFPLDDNNDPRPIALNSWNTY
jgi:hypothetical protein